MIVRYEISTTFRKLNVITYRNLSHALFLKINGWTMDFISRDVQLCCRNAFVPFVGPYDYSPWSCVAVISKCFVLKLINELV